MSHNSQQHVKFTLQTKTSSSASKKAVEADYQEQYNHMVNYAGRNTTVLSCNNNFFQLMYSSSKTNNTKNWINDNICNKLIAKHSEFQQTCHAKLKATLLKGEFEQKAIAQATTRDLDHWQSSRKLPMSYHNSMPKLKIKNMRL